MSSPRDPRARRNGAFTPPPDAASAAARLLRSADSMRAEHLQQGPPPPADEPPTGLLDLAAIRAAVAAAEAGESPNPASVAWLAGDDVLEPTDAHLVHHIAAAELAAAGVEVEVVPSFEDWLATSDDPPCRNCGHYPEDHPHADCTVHAPDPGPVVGNPDVSVPDPEPEVPASSPEPAPVPAVSPPEPEQAPAPVPAPAVGNRPLTWRSRHDPASRNYGVRAGMRGSAPVTDHLWPTGPVLDQGSEGACVGFALVDALNAAQTADRGLTAADAERIYRRAQQLDQVPGESYTGTSVLAGMQAGVEAGLFGGYRWCFGTRDLAQAVLQTGPVVIGIPWLSGMYETGPGGLVQLAGDDIGIGHCLAVVGIKLRGPQGQLGPYFVWQNSWGAGYGDRGLGYVHHKELASLLHVVGEAAVPVPGPVSPS